MLLSALEAPVDTPLQTTVCVIGSGPSGLLLTRRLAEARVHVLVLEAGPLEEPRRVGSELPIPVEYGGQSKRLNPTIAQQVGGTSSLWHGVLAPLDPIDFKHRPWIPHSGWPIEQGELAPLYQQAAIRLGVDNPDYFDARSLPPELTRLLEEMPFDRAILTNKMFIQPMPVKRLREDALGYLARARHAWLVYHARAVELLPAATGASIAEVVYLAPDSRPRRVRANFIVLSGGAYQNPRLLLNSRARWAKGVGNGRGLVGRYLADHPMGNLFQVRLRRPMKAHIYADFMYRPGQKIKSGLRLTDAQQEALRLPNHSFYLRPSFAEGIDDRTEKVKLSLLTLRSGNFNFTDLRRVLTSLNLIAQVAAYRFSLNVTYHLADLFFLCEQIPNPDSRLTLSEQIGPDGYRLPRADWRLSSADFESVAAFYDLLVERGLGRASFQPVHSRDQLAWGERLSSAAHHLGTCRMAGAPSSGVVDRNLKVFDIDNLYVCDGSVFPTGGSANSTLTAAALALRLGDHLAARIDRPPAAPPSRSTADLLTVAVTGASGFIGGNFVARHAGAFAEVRAIGRSAPQAVAAGNVRAIGCALDDAEGLAAALAGCDALVHLAYAPQDEGFNLRAMRALLAAAHKAQVARVVLVSTIAVYDAEHRGTLIEEDAPARTHDAYSVVKRRLEAELAQQVTDKGFLGIILQPTVVYGWPGVWTCNAADVAKHRSAILPEAGLALCNAVYVDDVSEALCCALAAPTEAIAEEGPAPRFLISGPEVVTWAEFYSGHAEMMDRLGLLQQLRIQPMNSHNSYHDDWKHDRIYRMLLHGITGRVARPLVGSARRALRRRGEVGGDRVEAALRRLTAPCRDAAWQPTGLSRMAHAVRFRVDCSRAAHVLGYRPRYDFAAGITATEAAIAAALRGRGCTRKPP